MNFDDYDLSEELKAKLQADYDADIKGLKAKNSDLIERSGTLKAELEKVQLDFAKQEEDAKVALAEKEGDIEKYKAAVAERDDRIKAVEQEFIEKDNSRVMDMEVSAFVSAHVSSDPAAQKYMESIFRDSVEVVNGEIKPKDVTKTIEDLKVSIVQDSAYEKYIKVDVGSGVGSAGSSSTGGAAISLDKMNATEEAIFAKQNPEQYLKMINS